jgi:hypothetical protein
MRWLIAASPLKQCYEKSQNAMVEYRVNMVTLTFKKNMVDDDFARKLLGMWLDMAKHRFGLELYVWKAEAQERGAIHFHLATGVYIPYKELCFTWNRLLYRNGIRQVNSNSTDVHAITSEKNAEAYLTDYLLNEKKGEGRRPIEGRLWGCSHKISQAGKLSLHLTHEHRLAMLYDMNDLLLWNRISLPISKFMDYYVMDEHIWKSFPDCELKQLYLQELELLKPTVRAPEFW